MTKMHKVILIILQIYWSKIWRHLIKEYFLSCSDFPQSSPWGSTVSVDEIEDPDSPGLDPACRVHIGTILILVGTFYIITFS